MAGKISTAPVSVEVFDNTEEARALRATRSALSVSGRGLLFLTAWNMLKIILSFLYSSEWQDVRNSVLSGSWLGKFTGIVICILFLAVYGSFYFYVGLRAMAEGHGIHKSSWYIVVAGILFVIHLFETIMLFLFLFIGQSDILHLVEAPVVLITLAAISDLFFSALKVRRHTRA